MSRFASAALSALSIAKNRLASGLNVGENEMHCRRLPIKVEAKLVKKPVEDVQSIPITVVEDKPTETKTETKSETKSEPKTEAKKEEKKPKQKSWPANPTSLLMYEDLIKPLKEVLDKGYRLTRKDVKEFDFTGFNIGKSEQHIFPSPRTRLTAKALDYEKGKYNRNLIDVILNIAFLYGVEQGRRTERRQNASLQALFNTLDIYRQKLVDLRLRVDELEGFIELKRAYPNLTDEDLMELLTQGLQERREQRLRELKKDFALDPSKALFNFTTPKKPSFKELEGVAKQLEQMNQEIQEQKLNKPQCTLEHWKAYLHKRGWTWKEWQEKADKKNVKVVFPEVKAVAKSDSSG